MPNKLPSHIVPLPLIADVLCFIKNSGSIDLTKIKQFTGKSDAYIRSSIATCRLLSILEDDNTIDNFADNLGRTPDENLKVNVIRKYIQQYEPFLTFVQYNISGTSLDDSARKIYVSYGFEGKNYTFLKELFISWGTSANIFTVSENHLVLREEVDIQLSSINSLNINLDNDIAIRLHIGNILGIDTFSTLTAFEIDELVDAYKKYPTDARGAIECAGRAFEDFLRRVSVMVNVDVSSKSGIGQVVNSLYNHRNSLNEIEHKIHSKQESVSAAIGNIRNMAGHSLEARTMERWDLTSHSACTYVQLVLSAIRSIYYYIQESSYKF